MSFTRQEKAQLETRDYHPIASHGVIGDLRTVALITTSGEIDWYCTPTFDSPSVFGAILDTDRGGYYKISALDDFATKQLYLPDTNVLITRFLSPDGVGELQDFMPIGAEQRLIRRVGCVRGTMRFRLECEPRFNYGRDRHATAISPIGAYFRSPSLALSLGSSVPLLQTAAGVIGEFELKAGESTTFVLSESEGTKARMGESCAERLLTDTVAYWQDWVGQSQYTGRWREIVNRSALALKLLTYAPSGALVAAPTASLPERLGGARNGDCRYVWVRDVARTLKPLLRLGFLDELNGFGRFLTRQLQAGSADRSVSLKVLYGIDGRTDLAEEVLDHLEGYRGSAPVRIGHGAARQLQLDTYGEVLDAAYLLDHHTGQMPYDAWTAIAALVDWLAENWDRPDGESGRHAAGRRSSPTPA
jgi:GH15 family glucan-1,4-alpha-glucosidase